MLIGEMNGGDRQLARWLQGSLAYRDYVRQGLLGDEEAAEDAPFKLSAFNCNYQVCKSYPALLVVARETSDEAMKKNSKCHRLNRFPVLVWRHPTHKSLLLRSSSFINKGFIGMLIKGQANSGKILKVLFSQTMLSAYLFLFFKRSIKRTK